MSANHRSLLALALWAGVVLILAFWKWWPHSLDIGDLHKTERAFVIPLPGNGILARMIDRGVMVTLTMPQQPKPLVEEVGDKKQVLAVRAHATVPKKKQKPAPPHASHAGSTHATAPKNQQKVPQAAAPVVQTAPFAVALEHARVIAKVCKVEIQSDTRVAACYAVIAVPEDRISTLAGAADKVSVWVEGK